MKKNKMDAACSNGEKLKTVLFDFGGVLAEEGFREGLKVIGERNGLDPDRFFNRANELVYETGYVLGLASEKDYWEAVRSDAAIKGNDDDLRKEILSRFILRPEMIDYADKLKSAGLVPAILSDQTNWLDEINREKPFYQHFEYVFNSFKLGKGKRDSTIFSDVCILMKLKPGEVLFVDDNFGNIERASSKGLQTIRFRNMEGFRKEMAKYIPQIQTRSQELSIPKDLTKRYKS